MGGLELGDDGGGIGIDCLDRGVELVHVGMHFRAKGLFIGIRGVFHRFALLKQSVTLGLEVGIRGENLFAIGFQFGLFGRGQDRFTVVPTAAGGSIGILRGDDGEADDAKSGSKERETY